MSYKTYNKGKNLLNLIHAYLTIFNTLCYILYGESIVRIHFMIYRFFIAFLWRESFYNNHNYSFNHNSYEISVNQ